MVARLTALYQNADDIVMDHGRDWYNAAARDVGDMAADFGVSFEVAAGVVAALSPQTRWRENLAGARIVLRACQDRRAPVGVRGYGANIAKAKRIALGEPARKVLGGPKVRAFWANICGDVCAVTVDVWAQRAATGRELSPPSGARYERIAEAYRAAAEMVGEHPRDFQAIIWLATRPLAEHWRDRQLLLEAP